MTSPTHAMHEPVTTHVQEVLVHLDWLRRVASRGARDVHEAEDDLQETLLRALKTRPRAARGPCLRAWLRRVVHTVSRQRARSECRRRTREWLATDPPQWADAFPDPAERDCTVERVRRALERVREPYGSVVHLRYIEERSAAEVASHLCITPEAVRQRTCRGLRLLRLELERSLPDRSRRTALGGLLPFLRRERAAPRLVPAGTWAAAVLLLPALLGRLWLGQDEGRSPEGEAVVSAAERLGPEAAGAAEAMERAGSGARSLLAPEVPAGFARRARRAAVPEQPAAGEAAPLALDLQPGDRFGRALALLGDLDGDGDPELAVGADGEGRGHGRGEVWIVSVDAEDRLRPWRKLEPPARWWPRALDEESDLFGRALAVLGDLDGDTWPELAVGAPWHDSRPGAENDGAVWIYHLGPAGSVRQVRELSAATEPRLAELLPGDGFGCRASALGDLDGDGIGDLVAGAHGTDDGGDARGAVWILFLRTDGSVRAARKISATSGGFAGRLDDRDHFGGAVLGPGDLDGDGIVDLAVGAHTAKEGGRERGALWLLYLKRDGTVRRERRIDPSQVWYGAQVTRKFAGWLAALGDLDGDGRGEIVVGGEGNPRVLSFDADGNVRATSKEVAHAHVFLGRTPDGRALRFASGNARGDGDRGWVKTNTFRPEMEPVER